MAAKAADMPQYTPPPAIMAMPAWDWTGFYLGLNAGYGWGQNGGAAFSFVDPGAAWFGPCLAAGSCPTGLSYDTDGFVGGAHGGYNWQVDQFVFGFEADIEYSDMNGGASLTTAVPLFVPGVFNSTSDIDWLFTLRARAGLAIDRVLIYATGGLAGGGVEDSFRFGYPSLGQVYLGNSSDTEWGWTAGGGIDVAITDHFILGAEVLYFDLGDTNVAGLPIAGFAPPLGTAISANYNHDGVIARARATYKF
jgi:outer membrane immunogenic protein